MIDNIQIVLTIIIGIFIGGTAGYIGTLMLSNRMSLMSDPLGHLTMPGVSIALLYNFDVSLGALIFLTFGTTAIWFLHQKTKITMDAITAVVFSSSLAIAFLFLSKEKASQALLGDISQISYSTFAVTVVTSILIFLVIKRLYSQIILTNISHELATVEGINTKKNSFIYLTCIALTVALGVRIIGGLMTAALVAIPACTSKNISKNLFQYSYVGLLCGCLSCAAGIIISIATNLPVGPMIIISSTMLFVISLFFNRNRT